MEPRSVVGPTDRRREHSERRFPVADRVRDRGRAAQRPAQAVLADVLSAWAGAQAGSSTLSSGVASAGRTERSDHSAMGMPTATSAPATTSENW